MKKPVDTNKRFPVTDAAPVRDGMQAEDDSHLFKVLDGEEEFEQRLHDREAALGRKLTTGERSLLYELWLTE